MILTRGLGKGGPLVTAGLGLGTTVEVTPPWQPQTGGGPDRTDNGDGFKRFWDEYAEMDGLLAEEAEARARILRQIQESDVSGNKSDVRAPARTPERDERAARQAEQSRLMLEAEREAAAIKKRKAEQADLELIALAAIALDDDDYF